MEENWLWRVEELQTGLEALNRFSIALIEECDLQDTKGSDEESD